MGADMHDLQSLAERVDRLERPQITPGCGLSDPDIFARTTHIVINPPFTTSIAPADCTWASGGVSSAALFIDAYLRFAREGARVPASRRRNADA